MENELIDKFEELFQSIYGEDAENYYQKKVFLDMNGPGDQIAKDLRIEFHWKENEKIIAAAWDFDRHPTYYYLRRWFT